MKAQPTGSEQRRGATEAALQERDGGLQAKGRELVSILLPTYNRASLLERCVDSVMAQSHSHWELIISDDASSDDTQSVSKMIVEKDSRIRYHRNSVHQGLPGNRNVAVSLARADLVLFIEDDLILEKDCLERLVSAFRDRRSGDEVGAVAPRLIREGERAKVAFASAVFYVGDARRKNMAGTPCVLDKKTGIIFRNFSIDTGKVQEVADVHACSLYRKSALLEVGGYSSIYRGTATGEETDLNLRLRKKGYRFYFQPGAVTHHRRISSGGVLSNISSIGYYYYFLRNHLLLRVRGFGWRSVYMIPCFLSFVFANAVRYAVATLGKKLRRQGADNPTIQG